MYFLQQRTWFSNAVGSQILDNPDSVLLKSEWHIADMPPAPLRAHGLAKRFKAKR